ncbi:MAG TPA: LysM peptidoglycan-binding domain-containing protein [Nitrospirota bacterium]
MTTLQKDLMHAACIALLLMIVPDSAHPQEQKEPIQQSEKTPGEQAPGKSGTLIVPTPGGNGEEKAAAASATPAAGEAPAEETAALSSEETTTYIIKKGDTLWDISNALLKDPFLWPFIWKANPSISNPDLIYPGNTLAIPSLAPIERALTAPAEAMPPEQKAAAEQPEVAVQPKTGETPASRLILPEEQPVPLMDRYALLGAGFVNQDESDDRIVGAAEGSKSIYGYDDVVYVRIHDGSKVNIGDKFLIYTSLNKVKHPKTGTTFGRLIRGLGILQITANDSPKALTARITLSFAEIGKGSMITPYQEPALSYPSPEKRTKDISGYILEVRDERTINGQADFVYLDKGSADGVAVGDKFSVYVEPEKSDFPRKKIGEGQVFLVKERTSTAVVRKSTQDMAKGDMVDFKK